jgi:hypothetical protein
MMARPRNKEYEKAYYLKHKERYAARAAKPEQVAKRVARSKRERQMLKAMIFLKYGPRCTWCGFDDVRALQIDHVNGGGYKELKKYKGPSLSYLKRVLADTDGNYQILCANCNTIKGARVIYENKLARVKSSGEDVFVLSIKGDVATVRRPVGTTDGIRHLTEEFTLPELETPDEARTREMAERFSLQQKFAALSGPETSDGNPSVQ